MSASTTKFSFTRAHTVAIALLAAAGGGIGAHVFARAGATPTPAASAVVSSPPAGTVRRVPPRMATLPQDALPAPKATPPPEDAPLEPPPAWQAEAHDKIEREVGNLRGERQVRAYLDTLLAGARRRGSVTPVETNVALHAVRSLTELSDEERAQMLNDYQERLLNLQADLQGTARAASPPPDGPRDSDRLLAELRRGGQSPETRAELRHDLMNAIHSLSPEEREAKLAEAHALLAGEHVE
jgi:hypothetical protein